MENFIWSNVQVDLFGRFVFLTLIFILGKEATSYALHMMDQGRRASQIVEMAMTDSLTELYSRNAYEKDIHEYADNNNLMLAVFDLNNLKKCNDNFGHKVGDTYLIQAASIIRMIFEPHGKCYRIGGDEFCCVIERAKECPIETLIADLRKEEEAFNKTGAQPVLVQISYGYATYDKKKDQDLEETRERADRMMYQIKYQIKKGMFS